MVFDFTLDSMTKDRTTQATSSPHAGRAIAAQRARINKSGPQIERETNGVIYVKLLSRLETGKKSLASLSLGEYIALVRALEWTQTQFAAETGVAMPEASLPGSDAYAPTLRLPYFSMVSSGLLAGPGGDGEESFVIDPSLPALRGRDVSKLRVMRVNGDAMVSPTAAETIPLGGYIVIEMGAIPNDADLVVAWSSVEGVAAIKQYREGPEVVLRSYSPSGPTFRAGSVDLDVRGVVRWIMRAAP